ncbi:hypothetical protein ACJA23_00845 [Mycoplasma corogypsi]|uniref:hypothetical protein n=1 Tax=Mycoplasma corogypsi TaxID=2106 RepID=UPI0038730AC0
MEKETKGCAMSGSCSAKELVKQCLDELKTCSCPVRKAELKSEIEASLEKVSCAKSKAALTKEYKALVEVCKCGATAGCGCAPESCAC